MRSIFLTNFAIVLCIFFAGVVSAQKGSQNSAIFKILDSPKAAVEANRASIASVREAAIQIDPQAFRGGVADRIIVPLFDAQIYEAKRLAVNGFEFRGMDDFTWRGKIIDERFSGDVVLTFKKGYVAGLIYSPKSVYEITPKGESQILVELDQTLYPTCAGGIKGDASTSSVVPTAGVDSGDRIDVLVLYTAAVRTSAGGDTQAQTIAQQAVDSTNTAYINSKIRQRVRLVGSQLTALVETGDFGTELSNLRADATTATTRETFKADLVDMLTNSTASCGIGYLMGAVGGNNNNAFTVTARTCAVGNLSFAHELGHNMASHHNPENGGTPTFPYAFGHYVNGSFRTVMSYADPCPAGCTRVAYFSNPMVNFNGQSTGIDNARDNARSINQTADWIANYRYSGSSITMTNFNAGELLPRFVGRDITWTSDNLSGNVRIDLSRDESTTWQTLVASTPNDGIEKINVGNRVSRRARLRVVSLAVPTVSDSSVTNLSIR